ncbi:hypothetical protein [Rhizobium sp. RAF56]|uniref:hypothetical protein n=1 Tax=Rhizobium sp. RAF56 TaxID=3233062 RepID=UPI003F95AD3F
MELFGIKAGQDIAQMIVGGHAGTIGTKPAQEIELLLSKASDVGDGFRPAITASRQSSSTSSSGYLTFALWRPSGRSLK